MGCKETHILTSQQYHYVSALRFHLFFIGSLWRKLCEKSDFCHNFSSPIASPSVLYVNGLAKLMTWRLLDVVSTVLDWFNARFARQCNNAEYHHYSVHWTFDIFRMGLLNKKHDELNLGLVYVSPHLPQTTLWQRLLTFEELWETYYEGT